MSETDTFDFLISDEDEMMLLLHAHQTPPENPTAKLYPQNHIIEIYRRPDDALTLEEVDDRVFQKLQGMKVLLVCETSAIENEDETEIIYAYEAKISD